MGQKVNPTGLRVMVNKNWGSRWYSDKKDFGTLLNEDLMIKKIVKDKLKNAAVASIVIERYANRVRVNVYTARPGIVIGRKGQDIEKIRADLSQKTGKEIYIEIHEVRNPDTNAQLVSEGIATQLERRISVKRAMKRAMQTAMDIGAEGIKVKVSGRLGGAEMSRIEWYKEGKIPLHTFKAPIEYGFTEASTPAGIIGVKVWICRNEDKESRSRRPSRPRRARRK
ncbi:MAG: 30S ribosomal protein S3 [Kiritimatiellae bacterium]|nr:30S ribosomal protein S3 [Kiritimatiellia bacterium]